MAEAEAAPATQHLDGLDGGGQPSDSNGGTWEIEELEPEEEAGAGGEVDALADAFINKFHHQLKLQRIESFIRHRETVRRGQAAGGVVV